MKFNVPVYIFFIFTKKISRDERDFVSSTDRLVAFRVRVVVMLKILLKSVKSFAHFSLNAPVSICVGLSNL